MKLTAWRICKQEFAAHIWTGSGARDYGGRWNSKGIPVVYVSGSLSLAAIEMLVHLDSDQILRRFAKCPVTIDRELIKRITIKSLPSNWRAEPAPSSLRVIGDAWVASGDSPVLAVPSAIVPEEWNYLLNPAHPGFSKLAMGQVEPFTFDLRLAH